MMAPLAASSVRRRETFMSGAGSDSQLWQQARGGDAQALGTLLLQHEERLLRIVAFRMDPRLRARIDATDVMQEMYIEAARRFPAYCEKPGMPLFLWLRFLALQKLMELHRRHLGTQARDAQREISIDQGPSPEATSAVLAARLLGKQTSPSEAAMRLELQMQLEEKLNELEPIDREVLALRHFEQLSNNEAAKVLQIDPSAASNRYIRALKRLKESLGH